MPSALLDFCHRGKKDHVYAGEIASAANAILKDRGETVPMEPRPIGYKLKLLGPATKQIGSAGRGLILLEGVRQQIHKLAWGLIFETPGDGNW